MTVDDFKVVIKNGNSGVGSQKASTSVLKVKADGSSTFSLTGAVDVSGIKKQMEAIEAQFGQDADDFSKIKLTDAKSTFTATFELPAGVTVPADPQVTDAYLGDCYKVTGVSVSGQKVTVTSELKQAFSDYKQLKDAVDSTGSLNSHDAGDSLNTIDDAILLTLSGCTIDKDAVANGDELTAVGTVAGDFSAVAQGSTGKAKRFAFAWKGVQTPEGKDATAEASDNTIQLEADGCSASGRHARRCRHRAHRRVRRLPGFHARSDGRGGHEDGPGPDGRHRGAVQQPCGPGYFRGRQGFRLHGDLQDSRWHGAPRRA